MGGDEKELHEAVEAYLDEDRFRRKVMLFQRCDNALQPLLTNLEEIVPRTDEELALYKTFLQAAELILAEMEPFLPKQTLGTLTGRLKMFRSRMGREMRDSE